MTLACQSPLHTGKTGIKELESACKTKANTLCPNIQSVIIVYRYTPLWEQNIC